MSTGDALVHGAASIAVEDVYSGARDTSMDQHAKRTVIRWVAVAVGVVAYIFALDTELSLVAILLLAYGGVVQLAQPVYAAFFWRKATAVGVISGLLVGITVTGLLVFRPEWRPFGLHEGLAGLIANLIVFIVVSLLTQPPDQIHVNSWLETCKGHDKPV
jgi:SSS family solute:Na+ symporter